MIENGHKNQKIYRKIFGVYPDNKIKNFKDLKTVSDEADLSQYDIMKDLIKGHALIFQKDFLCNENLSLKPSQKEYYVPDISFTWLWIRLFWEHWLKFEIKIKSMKIYQW